jgi:hypothetical protein
VVSNLILTNSLTVTPTRTRPGGRQTDGDDHAQGWQRQPTIPPPANPTHTRTRRTMIPSVRLCIYLSPQTLRCWLILLWRAWVQHARAPGRRGRGSLCASRDSCATTRAWLATSTASLATRPTTPSSSPRCSTLSWTRRRMVKAPPLQCFSAGQDGSRHPGRKGRATGRPATALGARAIRLQSRRFSCFDHLGGSIG